MASRWSMPPSRFKGRAVPVAWVDFEYPWKTVDPASQNTIERYLLTWLGLAVPRGGRLILIFDRGYARVELIKDLKHGRQPFLIRGRRKVIVQTKVRGRQRRLSLGRLPHRLGRPLRYRHVLYHSQKAEPVDVIVYRGKGFQEPWFLIVPPDSESWLATEEVVRLYRQRMQIEQCFRDWKSHLGLRGLHLQVEKSQRLLRLLMGFTLAYLIVLLLGQDPFAEQLRPHFEQQRRKPRHGTRRVLSVLSIALYLLSDSRWEQRARKRLIEILARLAQGRGVALLPAFSPYPAELALFSQSSILFSGQCGRNCLRCSRVRNAESLLPRETTPSVWFPKMRQHYVSFCVEESSSPANKFRQGPRQPHRNWWPPNAPRERPNTGGGQVPVPR